MIGTRADDLPTAGESPDMLALREYVTQNDATRFDKQAPGTLRLDVAHSNLQQRFHDFVFFDSMTVWAAKEKLHKHSGTPASFQELYLRRGGGDTIFMYDDRQPLGFYGARSGMEIYIKDTDPNSLSRAGGLEDVSQVPKYEMDDERYDKMENTVRAVRRREAAARAKAARETAGAADGAGGAAEGQQQPPVAVEEVDLEALKAGFPLGSRCEVGPGARRGTVAFVGKVAGCREALMVGVRLDEPQGSNDGCTRDGTRYFDCPGSSYGAFVRPGMVQVGDFPELDPFALASDDEF